MGNTVYNKPHFFFNSIAVSQKFVSPVSGSGRTIVIPELNRQVHSSKLRGDLAIISTQIDNLKSQSSDLPLQMGIGIQVEFESLPDVQLAVESLANATHGIDLHNIKTITTNNQEQTIATVYIPDGKLHIFEKKITDYLAEKTNKLGKPLDNRKLIDAIQSVNTVNFSSIWSDNNSLLPIDKDELIWWEVWVSTPKIKKDTSNSYDEIISDFTLIANEFEVEVSPHTLRFPEHTVINVKSSQNILSNNSLLLSRVAEIRAAKVTADFFDSLPHIEQIDWSQDLMARLEQSSSENPPYVCILDTGVNVEHPLLAPFATLNDQLTITDDIDSSDNDGHGSGMAGLAMWGDLTYLLASNSPIIVNHKLEAVKVINASGDNKDKPLGKITSDGVAIAEIANSDRSRTFSMSLSAGKCTDRGRASSWSSTLDALASDYLGEGENRRLFTICAGNTGTNLSALIGYPEYNQLEAIHDPAQSWNSITVGAYTNKTTISESTDYIPLAKAGGLSPYSTTSLTWDRKNSPIKPEVVFEGGNIGKDQYGCAGMQDLHLLSTNNDFSQRHLQTTNATSAATALAARFTAQLKSRYPLFWPETIRALTVHSADWTDEMFALIATTRSNKKIKKSEMVALTRMVGFGVPNLEKAMWSANNSLSLVIQDELQPFHKDGGIKTKDMHLHNLPWPIETLQDIGEADVELTVTLSYFIEPNPSSRNTLNKYSYASHQLRFDVKRPEESSAQFQKRINKAADGDKPDSPSDSKWCLGAERHKGSIHKDIWRGSAAQLAERGQIAIYPASGWWKTRTSHEKWDSKARYSLIVSLSVPEVNIDLYAEVDTKVAAMVSSELVVSIET